MVEAIDATVVPLVEVFVRSHVGNGEVAVLSVDSSVAGHVFPDSADLESPTKNKRYGAFHGSSNPSKGAANDVQHLSDD